MLLAWVLPCPPPRWVRPLAHTTIRLASYLSALHLQEKPPTRQDNGSASTILPSFRPKPNEAWADAAGGPASRGKDNFALPDIGSRGAVRPYFPQQASAQVQKALHLAND